jgi:hypothetical protein
LAKPAAVRATFRFEGKNPHAQAVAERQAARYVTRVSGETRQAINTLIVRAIRDNITPSETARLLRSVVGLTSQSTAAVVNYYEGLVERGETPDRAQRYADKYADKLLRSRAETIARTEIMGALNAGALESAYQRERAGLLRDPRKRWTITPDEATCFPATTPVMTLTGWKPIASVKPGDLVLTHQDRFRRVTAVRGKHYAGEVVRLKFGGRSRVNMTATVGHPVLTARGWVLVEQITAEDTVVLLAQPCVSCGELTRVGPGGVNECLALCRQRETTRKLNEICFVTMKPKSIERYEIRRQSVHDLQVEEDESFVAGGVVVHNCKICRPLHGQTVPLHQTFDTGLGPVMAPPVHPRCRCSITFHDRGTERDLPDVGPAPGNWNLQGEARQEYAQELLRRRERR